MYPKTLLKTLSLSFILLFLSCGEEEPLPDTSIGEWEVYSVTDESGITTIWEEVKTSLIDLIPEYACM